MQAAQYFTQADEANGYLETRGALKTYSDAELTRDYFEYQKACFNSIFGHNAQKFFNLICDELLTRGITHLPNIFGAIEVKRWSR